MRENKYKLSDFIQTAPSFQYAINLKYDLDSTDKIKNYIATSGAIDIIEDILLGVHPHSEDRARILIGPYGKGKSHLILVITALLYYKDKSLFENLLNKLKEYNTDLYSLANSIIKDNDKMLPVIISGTSLNMTQSFLLGLKNALNHEELEDIMPNTYFNSAIDMIDLWKSAYKETYKNFSKMIQVTPEEFINQLSQYNQGTYDEFIGIYPQLTSGSEFNPLQGIDVVDLYEDVVDKIKDKGYKGIYVVYDEFSKFLEGSINRNSAMEIKFLQDFAEKCNRSKEKQLHILLISHKNISNYVDKLPKEKIDAWKAVENRFKTIEINYLETQTYEIMSHVILKDEYKWEKFKGENNEQFSQLSLDISRSGLFNGIGTLLEEVVVYGTYPLHPITTYILPKISEKVAQNERTIFTFLSSNELNTLEHFIQHDNSRLPLMTPDYIYDYFEYLFKKENYNSDIYQTWRETTNALKKLDENEYIEESIIKTIALINIVGENQKLQPTIETIKLIFSNVASSSKVDGIIDNLIQRKILYLLKSKGHLKFIEATDFDVITMINDTIEKRRNLFKSREALNGLLYDNYIYANGYNDEFEIIRYFDIEFIGYRELVETPNWGKKIEGKISDGTIYAIILGSNDDFKNAKNVVENIKHKRIIFILPKYPLDIENLLRQHDAIEFLIGKNEHEDQDKLLNEELTVYLGDIEQQIQQYLDIYLKPELGSAIFYYRGKEQIIKRKALLNRLVSSICADVYYQTPKIVNELINNNEPTPTAISNRRKVLDSLLKNTLATNLGLIGRGLDVSIMQSTLIATGILIEEEDKTYLCTQGLETNIQNVLNVIRDFLLSTSLDGPQSFRYLYETLTKPEAGVGLKKGVIPIYIAVILHEYKRYTVIIRNGQEMEIRGQLLDDINEKPEEFEVYLENWNEEKEKYIQYIESIFDVDPREKEYNTFEYVFKAIHRWFMGLPNYTKEYTQRYLGDGKFEKVNREVILLRNSLRGVRINSREFIFVKLIKIFGHEDVNEELLSDITKAKSEIDSAKQHLIDALAEDIKKIYVNKNNSNTSFSTIMKDWYEGLKQETKTNLFNYGEDKFIKEIESLTDDYYDFIERVAKIVTGLRINDWDDKTITLFIERISHFKNRIEAFNKELKEKGTEAIDKMSYKVSYYIDDIEITKSIVKKDDFSQKAKFLYNELETLLEDYGTVNINEKRQILLEIFKKYC